MSIAELSYVRLEMRDVSVWLKFGEEVMGLAGNTEAGGCVRLRMDAMPFRYLVEPGDRDRFGAAGWACRDETEYRRLVDALREAGALTRQGSEAEAERLGAQQVAFATDPSGNGLELCYGRTPDPAPFVSPINGVNFVTGSMGLGHAVLPAPDFDATSAFYCEVLGFEVCDELTLPPLSDGAPDQRVQFLHVDNPRHHSLGLYNYPVPSGVVHVMAEVDSLDSVGCCLDRAKAADCHLLATLGRHLNDGMVSFYMVAPGGIPIEYGYDGLQFDWQTFQRTRSSQADLWGHEFRFPGQG